MNRRNALFFLLLLALPAVPVTGSALTSEDALAVWLGPLVNVANPLAGAGETGAPFPLFLEDLDRVDSGRTVVLDPVETAPGEDTGLATSD